MSIKVKYDEPDESLPALPEKVILPATIERENQRKPPTLRDILRAETPATVKRLIHLRDHARSEIVQIRAIEAMLAHGWGSPAQAIELTDTSKETDLELEKRKQAMTLLQMDPEVIKQKIAIMRAAGLLPKEPGEDDKDAQREEVHVTVEDAAPPVEPEVIAPEPEQSEKPCFCAHDIKEHPAGGSCNLCTCPLFSDPDEAEEVRQAAKKPLEKGDGE